MRCLLIAIPFWLWGAVFGLTMALPHQETTCEEQVQQAGQGGAHKYVVIYTTQLADVPFEFRMVVRADSETHAVLNSVLCITKQFGNSLDLERLKLVEVALKRDEK